MRIERISSVLVVTLFLLFWSLDVSPARALCQLSNQKIEAVETLVQVGKYRLNFQVIEGENLTILLEAGGGMDSREWNNLAPELARKTGATIVSYDRAGFGKSDLPETPHDMREEVDWLWQGLQKLDMQKDLILVGHSFGGWMIRLFASEHPEAVRGIVFVDPFTNEFVDMLGVEYLDNHPMAGKIPFDTSQPDKLTKLQRALVRMVGGGLGPKMEIMRKTKLPTDIPVVVITSGRPFLPKTEEQEAWRLSHEQMTALIKGGTLIVAEKSDHMVPGRQPDLIIEAVMKVIKRNPPVLKGLYLGQEPPGLQPQIFAPGIVSTKKYREFSGTFTPDGKEYYFFRFGDGAGMMACKLLNEGWAAPEPASFNTKYIDNEPHITPDGKIMFFNSNRPFPGFNGERIPTQIWFMERLGDSWGVPKHLCEGMFVTSSINGNIYLNSGVTKLENGKFAPLCEIKGALNAPPDGWKRGHHSSIAPDESFFIYDSQKAGSEWDSDENLFVCFRMEDGTWSESFDLGGKLKILGGKMLATISPDNQYLFFCNRGDIYWVDAKIIEDLKPKVSK